MASKRECENRERYFCRQKPIDIKIINSSLKNSTLNKQRLTLYNSWFFPTLKETNQHCVLIIQT